MKMKTDSPFTRHQQIGLFAGIPIFILLLLLPGPEGMSVEAQRTLAIAVLMAIWWITEALPIPITSLLPIILFPLLKICNAQEATRHFGDRNIFLLMG